VSTLPLAGTIVGRVEQADAVSIHGDAYTDITVRAGVDEGEGERVRVRVPSHVSGPRRPVPGDRVRLGFLLGQVVRLEYLPL
jgi:hypothetical protein